MDFQWVARITPLPNLYPLVHRLHVWRVPLMAVVKQFLGEAHVKPGFWSIRSMAAHWPAMSSETATRWSTQDGTASLVLTSCVSSDHLHPRNWRVPKHQVMLATPKDKPNACHHDQPTVAAKGRSIWWPCCSWPHLLWSHPASFFARGKSPTGHATVNQDMNDYTNDYCIIAHNAIQLVKGL